MYWKARSLSKMGQAGFRFVHVDPDLPHVSRWHQCFGEFGHVKEIRGLQVSDEHTSEGLILDIAAGHTGEIDQDLTGKWAPRIIQLDETSRAFRR